MEERQREFIQYVNDRLDNLIHASYIPIPTARSLEYTIDGLKNIHKEIDRFIEGLENDVEK